MKHRANTTAPTSTREHTGFTLTSGLAQMIGYDAVLAITGGELDELIYGLALYQPTGALLDELCTALGRDRDSVIRCAEGMRPARAAAPALATA